MKGRLSTAAAVALLALTLSGCSDGDGSTDNPFATPTARETGAATGSPDTGDSSTPSVAPDRGDAPNGWRRIEAGESRLSFAVPASWSVLDPSKLAAGEARRRIGSLAEKMNLTPEMMSQLLAQVDVFVVTGTPSADFADNINVVLTPLAELPSEESLRANFKTLNFETLAVRDVTTPLGPGVIAEAYLEPVGAHSAGVFVETVAGVANLTVSAKSRAEAVRMLERIVPTLQNVLKTDS